MQWVNTQQVYGIYTYSALKCKSWLRLWYWVICFRRSLRELLLAGRWLKYSSRSFPTFCGHFCASWPDPTRHNHSRIPRTGSKLERSSFDVQLPCMRRLSSVTFFSARTVLMRWGSDGLQKQVIYIYHDMASWNLHSFDLVIKLVKILEPNFIGILMTRPKQWL
jgi:hypothetical protein